MNKIVATLGIVIVTAACNAPAENDDTGTSDNALESSNRDGNVTKHGPPTCSGWACASGSRPVSDDELFELLAKYESSGTGNSPGDDGSTPPSDPNASSTPPSTGSARIVALSAIECVTITDACVRSCAIRTTCGGGGYVDPKDSSSLFDWISAHGAKQDGTEWAKRSRVGNVTCSKVMQPGAKAKCTVSPS
jgi:hypothetical protein